MFYDISWMNKIDIAQAYSTPRFFVLSLKNKLNVLCK